MTPNPATGDTLALAVLGRDTLDRATRRCPGLIAATPDTDPGRNLDSLDLAVTQSLAEAGRDREGIRSELFRALEAVRVGNSEQHGVGWGRRGPYPWAPWFPDPPGSARCP